ncbi:MAG: Flp pilus assembly protein CpaB [Solirubrobacteraceae bacterium]
MEASSSSGRIGGKWPGQALSGRRSGIVVAVAAAVLAGVLLYAFVSHYKKSSTPATVVNPSSSVVLATGFIPIGTPASQVAAGDGLQHGTVASGQALAGAITDSSQIAGEVATKNIYPGEQIVASDFSTGDVTLGQYLAPDQRAIEIPVDATHGLQGYVLPGDRIDLLTSATKPGTTGEVPLALNVPVLALGTGVNGTAVGTGSGSLVLAVSDAMAPKIAYASDSSKIWVLLRPPVWSKPSAQPTSTTNK